MDYQKPTVLRLPIVLREIEVSRVEAVSPTLQRIWFRGEQLATFSKDGRGLPPFRSEGPDDHVKFFFPSPVDGVLSLPTQADGTIDWPRNPRPVARDYTPRAYSNGDPEIAFEFVLHGHGIASTWAAQAKPGDRLHMAGPKASLLMPDARHFVLIGDQTALPAICNWLERLPENSTADVVIWIEQDASRIAIDTRARADIRWIVDTSTDAQAVIDAVKALPRPDADTFVWGAMESGVLRKLRAYYIEDCGLERGQIDLTAYWRRGIDDDQVLASAFRLSEMADLQIPFALRAAVEFRLAEHVAAGVGDLPTLAQRAGIDQAALTQVMPLFVACDVFKLSGEKLSLGLIGEMLCSPFRAGQLSRTTPHGRMLLAASGMSTFLKTGNSAYGAVFGHEMDEDARGNAEFGASLGHDLGHVIEALASGAIAPIAEACTAPLVVTGLGADAVLAGLLSARPDLTGTAILPAYALPPAAGHMEEAGLQTRATLLPDDAPAPAAGTLVITALGARWTDDTIAKAIAAHGPGSVWLIELVEAPESAELREDAMHINLAFGIRPAGGGASVDLSAFGLALADQRSTASGLRLSRFVRHA